MKKILLPLALMFSGCVIENNVTSPDNEPVLFGEPPPLESRWQEDRFLEHSRQPVDVMFVIDPSCSMLDNISDISLNIPRFFEELDVLRVDWRVGVISTHAYEDYSASGKLNSVFGKKFITPDDLNRHTMFSIMANTVAGHRENGLFAIWAAFSKRFSFDYNEEFYRKYAPLHIVVISDEEDQSSHSRIVEKVVERLSEVEGKKEAPVTLSFIGHTDRSLYECGGPGETIGSRYIHAARRMGGTYISICEEDWSDALGELAAYAAPPPRYEYVLTQPPIEDTIQILVERNGAMIDYSEPLWIDDQGNEHGDYFYNPQRNSVTLIDYEQQEDDIVHVNYEIRWR